MTELVLAIVVLHEVGKAGTHALREAPWARKPLIPGLALSDVYHVCSGAQWPVVLFACWAAWGLDWRWWAAAVGLWGLIWPLSKLGKGLSLKEGLRETWWWQILSWRGK